MGDTPVKRSMDEFLINPTVPMDEYSSYRESRNSNRNSLLLDSPNILYSASRSSKRQLERPATIRTFNNEAEYLQGYASEEEVASPVENDDFTFDSTSSDGDSASIVSIHETQYHAQTCNNAQQLCNRAQAIQLVSVGKPKVVSMAKTVDVPASQSPTLPTSDHEIEVRPSNSSMSHMRPSGGHYYVHSSISSSPRSSGDNSIYSPTPVPRSIPTATKSVRRKPNLPRIQTAPRAESPQSSDSGRIPQTAWPIGRPNFLDYDPYAADYEVNVPSTPSASKRKNRLSPAFSLKSLSRSLRRGSTSNGGQGEGGIDKRDIGYPVMSPVIADMHVPTRTSSKSMPKMVARGASERAAAIEIPPCPDDYQDDFNVPVWPQRSDSVANVGYPRPAVSRVHARRKSVSAFVSSQM